MTLAALEGKQGFAQFGLTELFFEGAEQSLGSGAQGFEVLAIEADGNQTITEGSFVKS